MRFVDYHIHSNHSCDGTATIMEICQEAIRLGIAEIGFSEHMDFEPKDWGFGFFNYERYTSEIKSAQESFKDKLVIHKGVEVDYQHVFEEEIRKWLVGKEFDFVIGSVHYLDHEIIDSKLIEHRDLRELYKAYFSEVIYSIKCGLFDVIGHLDFPRRFVGNRVPRVRDLDYKKGMNAVLGVILEKKMYLEINSSLLEETEMMPSKETFRQFVENGGKLISVGSDAHSTKEVGHGIKEVLSFLEAFNEKKLKLLFE